MRLIDADKAISDYAHYGINHSYDACDLEDILTECSTIEAIEKADYETRLKADMVAILTDIQLEIEELDNPLDYDFEGYNQCAVDCEKLIQQKIDKLKESEEKNE